MAEAITTKEDRQKTTLFTRIIIRLTIPLLTLAAIFTALQLTNQMNTMNEYYKIESRLAFDSVEKALAAAAQNSEMIADPQKLKQQLAHFTGNLRITPIQIFDLFNRSPLLKEEKNDWNITDYHAMEKSLREKQLGKPYFVRIDKQTRQLVAYIPVEGLPEKRLWVARTSFPLAHVRDALTSSRWTLGVMIFLILSAGLFIGRGLAKSIVNPIRTLNEATQEIMEGHLGKHVKISTGDEIETLANTFNHMSESLKVMKARAEDANPLTQLPGNQGIFHEINRRIYEKQKFVMFHTDLDRFKVFNDTYGLARGDEVIKKTANLLREVVKLKGSKDDFIGHQGGDDFMLIVKPAHAKELAEYLIDRFDKEIVRSVYRKEDYDRGYILAVDRREMAETGAEEAKPVKFPLLAISLAGITNAERDFADYFDCLSRSIPVKKIVKKIIQSSYLIQE